MSGTALKRMSSPVFSCEQIKRNFFFGSFQSTFRSNMFYKIGFFKNFGRHTGKRFSRTFFLIKLYTIKLAALLKRGFSSNVLLQILRKILRHLFYRTPPMSIFHFNSSFLTLSLRKTYIYIFQALIDFRYFLTTSCSLQKLGTNPFDLNFALNKLLF